MKKMMWNGIAAAVLCLAAGTMACGKAGTAGNTGAAGNQLVMAAAWKQTAAEYRALYYQAFNVARLHLDNALAARTAGDKPLAVITDVDDTVLNAADYWARLIAAGMDFFDDAVWDSWVAENRFAATPGALEFCSYAKDRDVEVFYVTNRDQGEDTYALAEANLTSLGFPFVDEAHLFVQRESSNKEERQQKIARTHNVVLMLGDNLNDFRRKYYVKDVDERLSLMEEDRELYGMRYIVLPNPTDGHWIRAIFGDSEPPATPENRAVFREAAAISRWKRAP
ncbi:MAG: 5'-nucleotidase, lipoprotein e(P4) family [Spirochaetaceae bacterium]|nr:5'-nucleotidase, lipoprotein e(P4) family [Spirochaetaceae bacterium]